MGITRRIFMKGGAMTVVGMAAIPEFLARAAMAAVAAPGHKRLVVIFQRGAADGLNIVVPHGEADYYALRPTILGGHFKTGHAWTSQNRPRLVV
jgi:uncharacterized protein (DUF1501 family)